MPAITTNSSGNATVVILDTIAEKTKNDKRLSRQDGLALIRCGDLPALGALARAVKLQKTGDRVYYNRNCHINLTNICASRCSFCAFSCDAGDPRAYCMTPDEVCERVRASLAAGITEVHMVSGLHPDKPFSYYIDAVRLIKQSFPQLHIKAFTAVELQYFSDISDLSIEQVLERLMRAGVGSLPGGGAEVLSARVRKQLCPKKASSEQWLGIMRTAHRLGLKSNATLLYGHIETPEEIIDHLLQVRQLQDETGGFQAFIPLPFHPDNTGLQHLVRPTAVEMLRMFCLARLMLDTFDHIKAYWIMTGLTTAQLALYFGADDVDGTVTEERITHAAGAQTAVGVSENDLVGLIRSAGYVPVQRDTLYNEIDKHVMQ